MEHRGLDSWSDLYPKEACLGDILSRDGLRIHLMEEVAHMMAMDLLLVLLLELVAVAAVVAGMMFDVRSLEVVGSVVALEVGFAVGEEGSGSVAGLVEEWVVVGEEDKIHLGVECLFVEEGDSIDVRFEWEEVMMEEEQNVAVAGALVKNELCYTIVRTLRLTAISSTRRSFMKLVDDS